MRLFIVDAFTDRPFAGNPAAVCPARLARLDEATMQALAAEMNLSETAFPVRRAVGTGGRRLRPALVHPRRPRWTCAATPPSPPPTCSGRRACWTPARPLRFHTNSGLLACTRLPDGRIEMDFPARRPSPCPCPDGLAEALGEAPVWTGRSRFDVVVCLESADAVRRLAPDFAALARLDVRGVIVTAEGDDEGFDFVSRFFGPAVGVPEDPVTGSAHCALAPYWAAQTGRSRFRAFQASHRGGVVEGEVNGDRVLLRGHAVTVVRGTTTVA